MAILDASEIFQFAIRIEETGEKFYRNAIQKTENEDVKKIFTYLANQEVNHKKIFEDLLLQIEQYETLESGYLTFLQAYADSAIFTEERLDEEISKVKDTLSAVDFCIRRELDSILFFHEMKNFVPEKQRNLIDRIVSEERTHYLKLLEIRENIKS